MSASNKKKLRENGLKLLSSWFSKFCRVLEDSCPSHFLIRGELYSDDDGDIWLDLLASDEDGHYSRQFIQYDPEEDVLCLSNKLCIIPSHQPKVMEALRELITKLMSLSHPVSRVYFEFSFPFELGLIEEDPKEEGSVIFYLMGDVSFRKTMVSQAEDTPSIGKKLRGDWVRG